MRGDWVTITARDGGRFRGYLSVPESGGGPGIVLLQEIFGVNRHIRDVADLYAEEGYAVLAPDLFWRLEPGVELGYGDADRQRALELRRRFDVERGVDDIAAAVGFLSARPECTGQVGALGFCLGGRLAYLAAARAGVDCAVGYYGVGIEQSLDEAARIACPMALHFGAEDDHVPPEAVERIRAAFAGRGDVGVHVYPGAGHGFNCPERPSFDRRASTMAHTRSIALFRRAMGPRYDLEALWERHCGAEFATRDAGATMETMVAEPYVNHVPTMTGGVGHAEVYRFYEHHFIPNNPPDIRMVQVSRTVGADRVVDELVVSLIHDREIDWLLPGVPPTGRRIEIPLVAVVCFRGDRVYHEHIYWDQASVLVQAGLLDPKLYPVAGAETARKVLDETLPSNTLMARWAESAAAAGT